MKKLLSLFSLLAIVVAAGAQPRCNADGTVTFLYKNENAKKVQVDVQFAGRQPMTRQADGTWTATLGPAAKDMYDKNYADMKEFAKTYGDFVSPIGNYTQ